MKRRNLLAGMASTAAVTGDASSAAAADSQVVTSNEPITSILNYIPRSEWAAISASSSTYDCSSAIDIALTDNIAVFFPAGSYFTTRTLNLTARNVAGIKHHGRRIIGAGQQWTRIKVYPGDFPCCELTGSTGCEIVGVNLISDNPAQMGLPPNACASTGVLLQRGTSRGNAGCFLNRIRDVRINLVSDFSRNGGHGTIGYFNFGAEHSIADLFQIYANQPMYIGNVVAFPINSASSHPQWGADYERPAQSSGSTTIMDFRSCQLIAYDNFRSIELNQVANIEFSSLYTGTKKVQKFNPRREVLESFMIDTVANLRLRGYQEVSGRFGEIFRQDHRYCTFNGPNDALDIVVRRGAMNTGFSMPDAPQPSFALLAGASVSNSRIDCNHLVGIYVAAKNEVGLADDAIVVIGRPSLSVNTEWTFDSVGSRTSGASANLDAYQANNRFCNYRTGKRRQT